MLSKKLVRIICLGIAGLLFVSLIATAVIAFIG